MKARQRRNVASLQRLAKRYQPLDLLKAQPPVCPVAVHILEQRVTGQFAAPHLKAPLLHPLHQRPPNSASPGVFFDEPALEKGDRAGFAAFGVWA